MSERGALRVRLDQLVREIAKFGLVGGLGLLVNMAVFNLVRHTTELPVVRASLVATVVAIVFNYVGFRYFTYRDRDKSGRTKELTLFLLFSLVGLVIENGVLYAATYGFGWDTPLQNNFFKFAGIGVATLFRFWSYRTWVFRALPVHQPAPAAESFLEQRRHEPERTAEPVAPRR
ncbi:GtrA family protein [Streptomyces lavendofoliae]|uniref:GtrA family protein n=1 Tax=Streptomyces lavendofoliae TaxID=67314 RepID=UPI003D92A91A